MQIIFGGRTKSRITVQAEDWTGDGVEHPYRMAAMIPRQGDAKCVRVPFKFGSAAEAMEAVQKVVYLDKPLRDYKKQLIEPDHERYL